MSTPDAASTVDIATSGLEAQHRRMRVIANNIANARTTSTPSGGPYRRQDVRFELPSDEDDFEGVEVGEVFADRSTDLKRVYQPGHPDANDEGMVAMPNVSVPSELKELMAASRAYEANAAVLRQQKGSVDTILQLLR